MRVYFVYISSLWMSPKIYVNDIKDRCYCFIYYIMLILHNYAYASLPQVIITIHYEWVIIWISPESRWTKSIYSVACEYSYVWKNYALTTSYQILTLYMQIVEDRLVLVRKLFNKSFKTPFSCCWNRPHSMVRTSEYT